MSDRTDAQQDSSLIPQLSSLPSRSFRPYPEYRDSGAQWLGEIPVHWKRRRLKYLSSINNETLGEDTDPNLEISYVDIGSVDEIGGIVKIEPFAFEKAPSRARRIVRDGDVIISTVRTYLRAIASITVPEPWLIVSTGFAVIRPKPELDSSFASYVLRAPYFVDRVVANSVGVSYPAITAGEIACFSIAAPDVREQRAIAQFLDRETGKIDRLVVKKERLIELLQEKRTALITHAVTKGLDPDVPMKDSGVEWLGNIPAHWEVMKLKRIAEISYGIVLELDRTLTEGTPIISLPNVSIDGELDLRDISFTPLREDDREYLLLKKGDLLFNWRNGSSDHVGKTALFDAEGDYTHVSFLLRVRFCGGGFIPQFYQRYLNSLRFTGFFMATKAGVNNTFNQTELMELEVSVPPTNEQLIIATFLDQEIAKLDTLVAKIREGIDRLKEFRVALISAAVTGKIDVREEVA
jgi:type I restriction enzyme, S subunit